MNLIFLGFGIFIFGKISVFYFANRLIKKVSNIFASLSQEEKDELADKIKNYKKFDILDKEILQKYVKRSYFFGNNNEKSINEYNNLYAFIKQHSK